MTETIRIVIDAELRREIDEAARRAGVSRSMLICDALREYIKRLRIEEPHNPKRYNDQQFHGES